MFKFIFESIKTMSIKLISDIALTFSITFFPKYSFYVTSTEEALKIVDGLNSRKQPYDETRICTTKDTPVADVPVE
jgi:hypothetical protein